MDFKEFLRSKGRLKILDYLKNHKEVFINQLAKEVNHRWDTIYNQLKVLNNLELVEIKKEEKAKGRAKKRRYYSITEKGIEFFNLINALDENKKENKRILRKLSSLLS